MPAGLHHEVCNLGDWTDMTHRSPDGDATDETVAAARDWVVRITSGEPTAEQLEHFDRWLSASPAHRAAFEQEQQFWQRLAGLQDVARAQSQGETGQRAEPPQTRRTKRPARSRARPGAAGRLSVAAGALAAACLGVFVIFGDAITAAVLADHSTAQGAQRTVTLSDGSRVHLNTDTAITIDYEANTRRVGLLRGEALFEVRTDADRPFQVAADDGVTEAVGTAFVVRRHADATSVTVTEGTVKVTSPGARTDPDTSVLARRGQRTRYANGGPPAPAEAFDLTTATAWRDGVIVIDDLPLKEALADLDRYRPGRIVLMADDANFRSVSGAFDVRNIDAAVAGIAATHGLTVTAFTPLLLILR